MRIVVIALVFLLALAGCLRSGGGGGTDFDAVHDEVNAAGLLFLSQNHGGDEAGDIHMDADVHRASMNVERVGYHNGVDPSGDPDKIPAGQYYTELAIQGDRAYLARGSITPEAGPDGVADQHGGFVILDIADPTRPTFVGEFNSLTGSDIEIDSAGELAFFATQRNTIEEIAGNLQAHEDPEGTQPRGIHIVDVGRQSESEPVELAFQPIPYNGPHTVQYYDAGSREFLFVQTYDFVANTVPSTTGSAAGGPLGLLVEGVFPPSQRVMVYEIYDSADQDVQPPTGRDVRLVQVAQYQIPQNAPAGKFYMPHDVRVGIHPFESKTLLYVAYWDLGVRIVDITEIPGAVGVPDEGDVPILEEVSGYTDFSPSSRNNIHLAQAFDTPIGDIHVTVAEPEIISADETGYITFLDTTDADRPQKAFPTSHWTLPGDLFVSNLDFSPHNFDLWAGKVALAHNHAGLWIIDVGDEEKLEHPKSVGFTMDVKQRQDSPKMQPYFWGVFEKDGYLFASDESSGLYVLEYTGP